MKNEGSLICLPVMIFGQGNEGLFMMVATWVSLCDGRPVKHFLCGGVALAK